MDILTKCAEFTEPLKIAAAGMYPYFKVITRNDAPEVVIEGRRLVMAGSNDYLGLSQHPEVKAAAIKAIEHYGTSCTGSRLLNGTIDLHVELEARLAEFLGREAAAIFSTGFQANLGTIDALVGKGDDVYIDRENHASIIDGCRLCFGNVHKFRHNDIAALGRMLEDASPDAGKLIVVDGVFSLRGDLVELPALVKTAKRHGAAIMIDDAHGFGVIGPGGRGTAEHFGLEADIDVLMGTFSKSLASLGGFIAGSHDMVRYVRHLARELVFSAAIPPASTAAALASLKIIQREPERRARVNDHGRRMREAFDQLGLDTCGSQTPIVSVRTGDDVRTLTVWRMLFDEGIFTNPILGRASGTFGLVRTSYMATHTSAHLEQIVDAFARVSRRTGLADLEPTVESTTFAPEVST